MKRELVAAVAVAMASTLAGCGGENEPRADKSPTQTATSSASASTSTLPTPEPTWDDKFSPAQLQRYSVARDRWLEFWTFYTDAARKGVDTPAVMAGFEKYSMAPLSEYSRFLDTYVRGGARMKVAPEVLWTSASKIGKSAVAFNYCLDYTDARITANGQDTSIERPYRRRVEVQMRKTANGWLKEHFIDEGVKPCSPAAP